MDIFILLVFSLLSIALIAVLKLRKLTREKDSEEEENYTKIHAIRKYAKDRSNLKKNKIKNFLKKYFSKKKP